METTWSNPLTPLSTDYSTTANFGKPRRKASSRALHGTWEEDQGWYAQSHGQDYEQHGYYKPDPG